MKTKIVRFTQADLPPLTPEQRAHLASLSNRPDSDIDYSDIPKLPENAWENAIRGRFYKPVKHQITAKVDADVLDWLKAQGKGYQTRLNAILRREMLAAQKSKRAL